MNAQFRGRKPWHWSIAIPLGTLAVLGIAFALRRCSYEPYPPLTVQRTSGTELPTIVLPPRARELFGKVVDKLGQPVDDVLVWVTAGNEPHWAYTDADGAFRLGSLEGDAWQVFVLARGHEPLRLNLLDTGEERTITLADDVAAPPVVPKLVRVPLVLRARASASTRLEGFEIVLTPVNPLLEISAPVPRRLLVDAGGEARVEDLIVGEYYVEVRPDWARGGTWPDLTRDLDSTEKMLLHHRAQPAREPFVIELRAGSIEGRLTDTENRPIEGALVLVQTAADASRVWPPSTSRNGAFVVRDLPPGTYVVDVRAGAASAQQTVTVGPGTALRVEFPTLSTARAKGP